MLTKISANEETDVVSHGVFVANSSQKQQRETVLPAVGIPYYHVHLAD